MIAIAPLRRLRRVLAATLLAGAAGLPAIPSATAESAPPPAPPWTAQVQAEHPLVGRAWLPAEGGWVEPERLAAMMARADFLLLGEKHDNPDHHRMQAWALGRVIAAGRRPAVAFEMFGTEKAKEMALYLSAHPRNAAGLGPALNWQATGWPDWALYQPIAQAALDAGLPLLTANLPAEEARRLARTGQSDPETASRLGLDTAMDAADADGLAEEIRDSHCGYLPEQRVEPMVMTQRARDATMALALIGGAGRPETDSAVLIAGSGHARADRGVPLHLRRLAPGARIFSLALLEVVEGETDPAAYARHWGNGPMPFDAVWFTPRMDGRDPCEMMAEFMEKRKNEGK